MSDLPPDYEPDFDNEYDEPDDEDEYDCGQFISGGHIYCSKVGSEECDWVCPHSNALGLHVSDLEIGDEP